MTYASEHKRLKPVLDLARKLDIATNPAPEALFEAGSGGFQIWATPDDHPQGWEDAPMSMGAFAKPCAFVAAVWWGWEDGTITHLSLTTDAYDMARSAHGPEMKIHNRSGDIAWARKKIRALFPPSKRPLPADQGGKMKSILRIAAWTPPWECLPALLISCHSDSCCSRNASRRTRRFFRAFPESPPH